MLRKMNAPFLKPDNAPDRAYSAMAGQADKWRGECIEHFARLEQIVEDLLHNLRRAPKNGGKVIVGQPVGAAFKHLRDITSGKGPLASKGKAIAGTLNELAPWFEWRAHLTHGVLTIWRGRNDQWLLAFAHRPANDDTVRTYALTWKDARELANLLQARVETLAGNARSLANAVHTD